MADFGGKEFDKGTETGVVEDVTKGPRPCACVVKLSMMLLMSACGQTESQPCQAPRFTTPQKPTSLSLLLASSSRSFSQVVDST